MTIAGQPAQGAATLRPVDEWAAVLTGTPRATREILRTIYLDNRPELEQRYRAHMAADPSIRGVLSEPGNYDQMLAAFLRWMEDITDPDPTSSDALARRQEELGELLARINYPPHAISSSLRKTKLWFIEHLAELDLPRAEFISAVRLAVSVIDLSLELRQIGFQQGLQAQSRLDEAYRLYSLGQNLAMERERQRALLMEWGHHLLSSFHQQPAAGGLPHLWKSDFGLWINHKGRIIFEQDALLGSVIEVIDRIDSELVPTLEQSSFADGAAIRDLSRRIEEELSAIKFNLNSLFEKHLEMENGRDPLTQLLNRRFMPSVLARELHLQKSTDASGFCVLLLDIDHFKAVNDRYGHAAGDAALQQIAGAVTYCVRPSDFVFRYGGEEIAVVLVDSSAQTGEHIGRRIRESVEALAIKLPQGDKVSLTVSVGVAPFAGELDYDAVVRRADHAMYQAKAAGRNRVVMATA